MKRSVDHIFNLSPAEVVEAFRWYLTARDLRMPNDDKKCEVTMLADGGAEIRFTEELQNTSAQPGELVWADRGRLGGAPRETTTRDG